MKKYAAVTMLALAVVVAGCTAQSSIDPLTEAEVRAIYLEVARSGQTRLIEMESDDRLVDLGDRACSQMAQDGGVRLSDVRLFPSEAPDADGYFRSSMRIAAVAAVALCREFAPPDAINDQAFGRD